MSSPARESHAGGNDGDLSADQIPDTHDNQAWPPTRLELDGATDDVIESIEIESDEQGITSAGASRGLTLEQELESSDIDFDADFDLDQGPATPSIGRDVSPSIPDDSPSLNRFPLSIPHRPAIGNRISSVSSRSSSVAASAFEHRFQSRFSLSPSTSFRASSPAFLTGHSRQSSATFRNGSRNGSAARDDAETPWQVVSWTRLRKLASQCFSEPGKRQFGTPTCLAASTFIVVGTSRGLVLIFDYKQTLKSVIGQNTIATECGAVTSLAIAADYSAVASGHATGHILTWEISRPAKPFLHIPPVAHNEANTVDGHVPGRSILHIGFLGTRRTAMATADEAGMAFSHLATRGLGPVARSVRSTRLLGRYPSSGPDSNRKPSSVLGFAPLPLGNVEQDTDTMGLTAMLTPYLLVIVSTTPVAQTQHKVARPKEVTPHSAVSGCLAWFPAVRLTPGKDGPRESSTKLVYCWSDVLSVLDVEVGPSDDGRQGQSALYFHTRGRWICPEAIVAVQWLSRSVIGVLTISQRLVIIEDGSLHVMESVDLLQKHIYHKDYFSAQLRTVVEETENEAAIHGVVADGFFMSFRVYKGRIFLLGHSDIEVGALSNWADRLTALVEHGDDIAAIRLAMKYYTDNTGVVSVGLSEDPEIRHQVVKERLLDLVLASCKYRFSDRVPRASVPSDLAPACFDACLAVNEREYLLEDVYELFRDANHTDVFLNVLEEHIFDDTVKTLPPALVQDLVSHYVNQQQSGKLEEILCRLDASTFDLDQATTLCKAYLLYDALAYIWTQALRDWVTPAVEMLTLFRDEAARRQPDEERVDIAARAFTFFAFSFTGRSYPNDEFLDENAADEVKDALYAFLFAEQAIEWPPDSGITFTSHANGEAEPNFPYIRLMLDLDTASFMSMLNEAFEDPYLNDNHAAETGYVNSHASGRKLTRQHIISIMLDVMASEGITQVQRTYLDVFIARCLPKFPQFVILSETDLQSLLARLCTSRHDEQLAEECQLSVEYLLSVYHPPVTDAFLSMLKEAGFKRVLKTVYRNEADYAKLLRTSLDSEQDDVALLSDISDCLKADVSTHQRSEISDLLCSHSMFLLTMDTARIAQTIFQLNRNLLPRFIESVDEPRLQFDFLRALLEPALSRTTTTSEQIETVAELDNEFNEQYVRLMCRFDASHVADYIRTLRAGCVRLHTIRSSLEEGDRIDAVVLLLAREGQSSDAMQSWSKHMMSCDRALCELIARVGSSDDIQDTEAVRDVLDEVKDYTKLGIWLCQGQAAANLGSQEKTLTSAGEAALTMAERLWVDLVDSTVMLARDVSAAVAGHDEADSESVTQKDSINTTRSLVQQVFTAVLSATTSSSAKPTSCARGSSREMANVAQNQSFLRIFRAFLERASTLAPRLTDIRAVLLDIFSAYAYESQVLALAHGLLGATTFQDLSAVSTQRLRGWKPRALVCEKCRRRAWGPGVGDGVWWAWALEEDRRREADVSNGKSGSGSKTSSAVDVRKGKKSAGRGGESTDAASGTVSVAEPNSALVVFACRHTFHRGCLLGSADTRAVAGAAAAGHDDKGLECLVCHPMQLDARRQ